MDLSDRSSQSARVDGIEHLIDRLAPRSGEDGFDVGERDGLRAVGEWGEGGYPFGIVTHADDLPDFLG